MVKMVYGVGINDADYQVQVYDKVRLEDGTIYRRNAWCCPFYRKWRSMLERCYSEKWLERYPSYEVVKLQKSGTCSVTLRLGWRLKTGKVNNWIRISWGTVSFILPKLVVLYLGTLIGL